MRPASARHVLMTADAVGGVWTYALDLAAALGASGTRVSLAVLGPTPTPEQRADAGALPHVTLYHRPGRLEWMPDAWEDVAASGAWLLELASRVRPDIVHLNGYVHASLPWAQPVVVVAHSCVFSWWSAVRGGRPPAEWETYAERVTSGLHAASIATVGATTMLEALQAHYGRLEHVRVIPNGGGGVGDPVAKEPLILSAGRVWDEAKNVAAVCEVARWLPWPIYIAGSHVGPTGESAQAAFSGVRSLGQLDRRSLHEVMARAAVFVLPARYEPFGLTALEAGLAGCALVLGDIPTLREVWGDAAIYVPPDNLDALRAAIALLMTDAALRDDMASRARRRARTFTRRRMAAAYQHIYGELTREGRPLLPLGAV